MRCAVRALGICFLVSRHIYNHLSQFTQQSAPVKLVAKLDDVGRRGRRVLVVFACLDTGVSRILFVTSLHYILMMFDNCQCFRDIRRHPMPASVN